MGISRILRYQCWLVRFSGVTQGPKTNGTERLASSVVRQVTFQLRNSAELSEALGEHVKLETNWWSESTNHKVDVS
jgi:hypothetical protein